MIDPIVGVDPEVCVTQGAAIWAAVLNGQIKDVLLLDATGSSYGIGLKDDKYEKLIPKNSTVPTRASKVFTTTEKNQSSVTVPIYHGEDPIASKNTLIYNLEIKAIPLAPAGVPQIEVTLDLDPNLNLEVSAKDLATQRKQAIVAKSLYSLSKNELEQRIEKFREIVS